MVDLVVFFILVTSLQPTFVFITVCVCFFRFLYHQSVTMVTDESEFGQKVAEGTLSTSASCSDLSEDSKGNIKGK